MMHSLQLTKACCVLCVGAHPDDIEIGCGATLATILDPSADIHWVVFSGNDLRRVEAEASANCWLKSFKNSSLEVFDFEDGFFPQAWESIKREFHRLSSEIEPDLVFTHHLHDRHQDHRVLAELTWQSFRNQTILEYEIPKYEGDLGHPNLFIPIDEESMLQKADRLLQFHQSQSSKTWFDRELFLGLARVRGAECAARYAEAFHARKLVIQ